MLYVIIVETGEYSDRNDWVGGVYDSRAEAEQVLLEKNALAKQCAIDYDIWLKSNYEARKVIGKEQGIESYMVSHKDVEDRIGKPQEGQAGDRFYIVNVPLNTWGQYDYVE